MNSKKLVLKVSMFFFALLVFTNASSLELWYPPDANFPLLRGDIQKGDFEKIQSYLKENRKFPVQLQIASNGGDVHEAIKIGTLLRESAVLIQDFGSCSSACFLIWVGAVDREASEYDQFGLHRPFFDRDFYSQLSLDEAKSSYALVEKEFTNYLKDMGVPEGFVNSILGYSSNEAMVLSGEEVLKIVGTRPPAVEELLIAKCGSLTESESIDDSLVSSVEISRRNLVNYDGQTLSEDDAFVVEVITRRLAQQEPIYAKFSRGYIDYLKNRRQEIRACEGNFFIDEQIAYFKGLGYLP